MGFTGEIVSARSHYEEFVCAICVQVVDLQESLLTSCNHVFCRACLEEWMLRKRTCPTCQRDLGLQSTSALLPLRAASPLAWRVLSRIRVRCPLAESGCAWEGDYSELQPHLQSSSAHEQQEASGGSRGVALALKEQANAKFAAHNYRDALQLYSKAISICDDVPELFSNRAAVYLLLQDPQRALADATRATELRPDFAKAWLRAGSALLALGQFADAQALVRAAPASVRREPPLRLLQQRAGAVAAAVDAARAAMAAADFARARAHLTDAMSQLDGNCLPQDVLLLAARAECEAGSCERAQKLALQVLRADASQPAAFVVRALALLYSGNVDDAVKCVKEALRLSPDDADAQQTFRRIRAVRDCLATAKKHEAAGDFAAGARALTDALDPAAAAIAALPPRSAVRAQLLAERANLWKRAQQFDHALRDCADALYIEQDNRRAWLTRLYVLHAQGKHEEALRSLEPAMQVWGASDPVMRGAHEKAQFEVRKARRPDYYAALSPRSAEAVGLELRPLSALSSEMEIKAAYKRRALECHPDRVPADAPVEARTGAEREFKLAGEALEVLTDSFKRKLYDEGFDKEAIDERVRRASQQGHGHGHGHA